MTPRSSVWKAIYYLAALLLITPLFDLLSQALPLQPGTLVWRYGFLGLLANNLLTPMLGLGLAAVAAATLEHDRVLRAVAAFGLLLGLALTAAAGLFVLDVLQLGASVPPENAARFRTGAAIALVKYLASVGGYAMIGGTGLRAARSKKRATSRGRAGSTRPRAELSNGGLVA